MKVHASHAKKKSVLHASVEDQKKLSYVVELQTSVADMSVIEDAEKC